MKHFFIDETTGKLFVIPEMPERPVKSFNAAHYVSARMEFDAAMLEFEESLQSAKAKAVEVDNEFDVLRNLASINEWEDWWRSEEGVKGYMTIGAIYSLDCEVEIRNQLAFITFNTE
jgi:hypothetical protein